MELVSHNLFAADRALQDSLVENNPEHWRRRSRQDLLSLHTSRDGLFYLLVGYAWLTANNRSRISLSLEKARHNKRLPSMQRVRYRFNIKPSPEPPRARPSGDLLPQTDKFPVCFQGIVAALSEVAAWGALTPFDETDQALTELGDFC
ncbi:hypothetical protein GCM10009525_88550 [Streptosporangium amethystogenes subsp. fukuiense]